MDKISDILWFLPMSLLFWIGVFLVVGTLKGVNILVDPPNKWYVPYILKLLRRMGTRVIYYHNIFVGIIFIIIAVYVFLRVISLLRVE